MSENKTVKIEIEIHERVWEALTKACVLYSSIIPEMARYYVEKGLRKDAEGPFVRSQENLKTIGKEVLDILGPEEA